MGAQEEHRPAALSMYCPWDLIGKMIHLSQLLRARVKALELLEFCRFYSI